MPGEMGSPGVRPGPTGGSAAGSGLRVAGVVLAAGLSTRMGAFKQLLPLAGRTLIECVVEPLVGRVAPICVVVGHRAQEVEATLAGWPVQCVANPRYREGMVTSVQAGIRAARGADGYLVCLGDQPGMEARLVEAVLAAAVTSGRGVVVPTYVGRRGHPVFLTARYGEEVLALGPGQSLNAVSRGHPSDILELETGMPQAVADVDTPEDWTAYLRGSGRSG